MHRPGDLVESATRAHRCPAVTRRGEPHERVAARPGGIDDEHVASRDEDLVECSFGDLECAVDDLSLLRSERRLHRDHVAQLFLGDLLALHGRVAPHQPHRDIGRMRQQPHRRAGQPRQDRERPGHQQTPALRLLHGDPLRCQLAEHQREVRQHERDDHHRCGARGAAEEPERFLQRLGERDRGCGGREESGERDADLDGREELVRLAGQPRQHRPRAGLLLQPLQLPLAQRHHRQLGAGERRVDEHQHDHQTQLDPDVRHRRPTILRFRPPRFRTPPHLRHREHQEPSNSSPATTPRASRSGGSRQVTGRTSSDQINNTGGHRHDGGGTGSPRAGLASGPMRRRGGARRRQGRGATARR